MARTTPAMMGQYCLDSWPSRRWSRLWRGCTRRP